MPPSDALMHKMLPPAKAWLRNVPERPSSVLLSSSAAAAHRWSQKAPRGAILAAAHQPAKSPWTLWPPETRRCGAAQAAGPLSSPGPIGTRRARQPHGALNRSGQYLDSITIFRLSPLANNLLTPPLAWSQSCSNPNPLPSSTSCFVLIMQLLLQPPSQLWSGQARYLVINILVNQAQL